MNTTRSPLATPEKVTTEAPASSRNETQRAADLQNRNAGEKIDVPVQTDRPETKQRGPVAKKTAAKNVKVESPDDMSTRSAAQLKADKTHASAQEAKKATKKAASKSSSPAKSTAEVEKKVADGVPTTEILGRASGDVVPTDEVLGKVTNAETEISYDPNLMRESYAAERNRLEAQRQAGEISPEYYDAQVAMINAREENKVPPFVRNRSKA